MLKNNRVERAQLLLRIEKKFPPKDVCTCYKYILENKDDAELLNLTLRRINKLKYIDFLPSLLAFTDRKFNKFDDVNLKVFTIKTIALYKNKNSLDVLLNCLNNKNSNYKIRLAAADALGRIGDLNAFDALGRVLEDESENSAYLQESAAAALGMLGDSRALDVFNSIMLSKKMFLDKFVFLKERIIEAIAKFDISKNNQALDVLKNSLLDNNSSVRISAIEAISNADVKDAYSLIYERLVYDDDIEVKKNALVALYNISDRRILDEVLNGDFAQEVKNYAFDIIKEYEDE